METVTDYLTPGELVRGTTISRYLEMLAERSANASDLKRLEVFDSLFFTSWRRRGYAGVKRAAIGKDLFSKDLILIPLHEPDVGDDGHWSLVAGDPKLKIISCYDSIPGRSHRTYLYGLLGFLEAEASRRDVSFDKAAWRLRDGRSGPKQCNTVDCGVYVCGVAEALSRGASVRSLELNPKEFRRRMAQEIRRGQIEGGTPDPNAKPYGEEDSEWSFEELERELNLIAPALGEDFEPIEQARAETPEREPGSLSHPVGDERPTLLSLAGVSPPSSPVLSLSPGWTITESMEDSIEILPDPRELVEMQVDEEVMGEQPNEYEEIVREDKVDRLDLAGPSTDGASTTDGAERANVEPITQSHSRRSRQRSKNRRRVMRIRIPGTDILKRVNVKHLGLTPFKSNPRRGFP